MEEQNIRTFYCDYEELDNSFQLDYISIIRNLGALSEIVSRTPFEHTIDSDDIVMILRQCMHLVQSYYLTRQIDLDDFITDQLNGITRVAEIHTAEMNRIRQEREKFEANLMDDPQEMRDLSKELAVLRQMTGIEGGL